MRRNDETMLAAGFREMPAWLVGFLMYQNRQAGDACSGSLRVLAMPVGQRAHGVVQRVQQFDTGHRRGALDAGAAGP